MFSSHPIKRSLAGGIAIAAVGFPTIAQARFSVDPPGLVAGQAPISSSAEYTLPANFHTDASSGGYRSAQLGGLSAQQRLDQLRRNVQQRFVAEGGWHLSAASTPSVATSSPGFEWSDAGIGAAGATVLLGAGALGVGMTRRRRRVAVS